MPEPKPYKVVNDFPGWWDILDRETGTKIGHVRGRYPSGWTVGLPGATGIDGPYARTVFDGAALVWAAYQKGGAK